ncbi:Binding-protein-dependent transport systems inner membrane component [Paraburkholderia piptadeniae]|uniref:Binding-protein-dependent transport systems inner membrane component n=1 Tax=Paraburkholderia piptadeniae TaxID=1701573 RepID=A0A1N7RUP3_9BURK|nr:ABC transporter permease [Paraburkholderia piptadeniae]SIT38838.1 Binding-protein-dependent transport systems inner membrane component [Paraburkholderia piptadeniae]
MSTTASSSIARSTGGSTARVARFVATRVGLSLITLWLLSIIVFAGGQLLPGDIGRALLGPLADARAVAALNHQLGADRPLLTQYTQWITHFVHGDMGMSYAFREPVAPFVGNALENSAKLGFLAFIVVVPLGIAGGVWAAMHAGRWLDRTISIAGLSATVVPEFVSSIVLILVFGVWLQWLPIEASYPANAGMLTQLKYLILPVLPLVFVFFGYIARMARAGTVEALDADYTRTAILKGLPPHIVIWRHVLRNALLPTITVAATQLGYMIGGLVVVETLFHYQGIGSLIYNAAKAKDFPMLEAGVLTIGVVYTAVNLIADALYVLLNPRLRVRSAE